MSFIILTNYGREGWGRRDARTWEKAVQIWLEQQQSGNADVVIAELCRPRVIRYLTKGLIEEALVHPLTYAPEDGDARED